MDTGSGRKETASGVGRNDADAKETLMRREFILAISIFAAMAVFGTVFGVWFASSYGPKHSPAQPSTAGSPETRDAPAIPPVPVTPK